MNQKRIKGFTLIELLAVIVILAIIALIAVPVIMNIINKANKSAFKDTAYGIVSAGELYFAERQLEPNGMLDDVTIDLSDDTNTLGLKGDIPKGSIVISKEGKTAIAVQNGRYCITKGFDDKDVTVIEDYEECKNPGEPKKIISSENACVISGTCSAEEIKAGILVNVKVNDTQDYDFYVIADTGKELTLVMDRNLGNKVAWYKDDDDATYNENNSLGPITALNNLNVQTANWKNIDPIKSYSYDNNLNGTKYEYGYQKFEIQNGQGKLTSQDGTITEIAGISRARLITYYEVTNLYILNNNSTPAYLYENLSSNNNDSSPKGYWFMTSVSNGINTAHVIWYDGNFTPYLAAVSNVTDYGLRPVITITK